MPCRNLVSVAGLIDYERLVAPREDGELLIEPRPDDIARMLGVDSCGAERAAVLDTTVGELRGRLRESLGLTGPVILTGHQAEFSHAGVFAKTIAIAALRDAHAGQAVFLSVDSDVPAANRLPIPLVERGAVRREFAPIPGCDPQLPIESQAPADRSEWRAFFERLAETIADSNDSVLEDYVAGVFGNDAGPMNLCSVVERGFVAVVDLLGLGDIRIARMSELCRTPAFGAFAAHLMLNASDFARFYNDAQRDYRVRRHERNQRRPAPPLEVIEDRIECPLWITSSGGRRHRLFVTRGGDRIDVYADDERVGELSVIDISRAATHESPWSIEGAGWRLRPRALTLSAFIRLFVSDLFVHGIGGARYDEMTEDFIRRFMDVQLPPACCVTATLRLPLPRFGVDRRTLAVARRARRDIHFNPQSHLEGLPAEILDEREKLISRSGELRASSPHDRAARRQVFARIRELNHVLLHHDPCRAAGLEQRWRELEREERSDSVAADREYFYALHSRGALEELNRKLRAAFGADEIGRREPP